MWRVLHDERVKLTRGCNFCCRLTRCAQTCGHYYFTTTAASNFPAINFAILKALAPPARYPNQFSNVLLISPALPSTPPQTHRAIGELNDTTHDCVHSPVRIFCRCFIQRNNTDIWLLEGTLFFVL
jgi:hypothetical protein